MGRGENNPRRPFIEVVTLSAWRSEYRDGGIADVFIDVGFDSGRVGGDGAPVRFQLALREAQVLIHRDAANVLELPANSVVRQEPLIADRTITSDQSAEASVDVGLSGGAKGIMPRFNGSARADEKGTRKTKVVQKLHALEASHLKTETGWAYRIRPSLGRTLSGVPWRAEDRRLQVKDPRYSSRRGEPPEPRVEIRCRREDLVITKIEFKDRKSTLFNRLTKEKQAAVEQYIKSELTTLGFDVGDVSDPYTVLVLADAALEVVATQGLGEKTAKVGRK